MIDKGKCSGSEIKSDNYFGIGGASLLYCNTFTIMGPDHINLNYSPRKIFNKGTEYSRLIIIDTYGHNFVEDVGANGFRINGHDSFSLSGDPPLKKKGGNSPSTDSAADFFREANDRYEKLLIKILGSYK